ncbi:hypothetical protein P691DRAFT_785971 [Macrolepiota fuliginosa MF-IS2]|uniref:Uncharacterized protein n=1 Tax=Macrolepiota fuliginosa MF-IS2 TaxID=1400762 RepID=A0A9P5X8U0_9AGAR|nr:hypothetical protein P691DRAFT_785971 [Macrolepiota fuliginosa MF-IS2]
MKCKNTWPFLALVVWEACLCLLIGITGVHTAHAIKKNGWLSVDPVPTVHVMMGQVVISITADQVSQKFGTAGHLMWWVVICLMFLVLQFLLHHEKDITMLTIIFLWLCLLVHA